jgi:hypothetical protein
MKNPLKVRALIVAVGALAMFSCGRGKSPVGAAPTVNSVGITPLSQTVLVGATFQFKGTVDADSGVQTLAVTWESSNLSVATVDATGLVTAIKAGLTTIDVISVADPSKRGVALLEVKAPPGILTLGVSPSSVSVIAGGTQLFAATVTADPGVDTSVTWSSSNLAAATVNSITGFAITVAAGTTSITATSNFDHTHFASGTLIVTGPSFTSINGTYTGAATLTTNTATPGTLGTLPTCAGSSTEYSEGISLSFNSSGVGTAAMMDATSFPRSYSLTLNSSLMATATGSFPFLGTTVPGWISMTATGTTLTFRETTQFGSCANSYAGSLTKQ